MGIHSTFSKNFIRLENVLIIGNGGRENSLAWAIQKNELVKKVYLIPGNAGSERINKCERIKIDINNKNELVKKLDFFNIDLIWNTGIGFGLLSSDSTLFYNVISGVILTVIVFLIFIGLQSDKYDKSVFSLIIGGAVGNFYDRANYSAVPDFIDIHYENFHWFTFNVADIFISLGIFFIIIKEFFFKPNL